MNDDFALLQSYVREHSDAAFETLMQRHVDLVYSSALRLTADQHLAEDVTQAVFIVLARKAALLKSDVILPAWLLTVTKLTASNARRNKSNQRRLEQETAALNQKRSDAGSGDWAQLAPLLDGAIDQLGETDRAAVVLRYFKRCSINELAAQLHLSPAAAEKRVQRATEKLRRFFAGRGLTLSALSLGVLLAENSVHAAPPALAAALPQALAVAHGGLQISNGVTLANGALKAMTIASTKQLAACAAIFLILGVAGGLSVKFWLSQPQPIVVSAEPQPDITDKQILSAIDTAVNPEPPPVQVEPLIAKAPDLAAPVAGPAEHLQVPAAPPVNLLPLANAAADSVNGVWRIEDGELVTTDMTAFSRFEIPYIPPEEYDFKLDFTVREPRGDVAMILAKNNKQIVWKMGALGNHVNVFESVGGYGDQNATRRTHPRVFGKDQRCQVVVQVRDRWIAAYVNGRLESWHPIDYANHNFHKFWKLPHTNTLGVGMWATSVQIHSAEIAEVRGTGRALRAPGEEPVVRERPQLTDEKLWANAVDLLPLIDTERDAVAGRWMKTAQGVDCAATPAARLEIPYQPPEEYDFKIVFTRQAGGEDIHQILGINGKAMQWAMNEIRSSVSTAFHCLTGTWEGNNPTTVLGLWLQNNQRHTSIVQVRKNSVAAFINGKFVSEWSNGFDGIRLLKAWKMPTPGLLGIGSNKNATVFHSIEILEITGKGGKVEAQNKRIAEPVVTPQLPPKVKENDAAF